MPTNIYSDKTALCQAAAELITDIAKQAIVERGQFFIALSGGSTPKQLYELLADPEWSHQIEWSKWQFFWSDERLVPLDDERSNFSLAEEVLLSKLEIDPIQIHAVPIDSGTADHAATSYETTIRSLVPTDNTTLLPRFDLILLGLGSDGHTASLFPDKPTLTESQKLVVATEPGKLPPPVERVTFTFPLINAARNVMFLVSGSDKTAALHAAGNHEVLNGEIPPAAQVSPENGELYWLVDAEAATIIETD